MFPHVLNTHSTASHVSYCICTHQSICMMIIDDLCSSTCVWCVQHEHKPFICRLPCIHACGMTLPRSASHVTVVLRSSPADALSIAQSMLIIKKSTLNHPVGCTYSKCNQCTSLGGWAALFIRQYIEHALRIRAEERASVGTESPALREKRPPHDCFLDPKGR